MSVKTILKKFTIKVDEYNPCTYSITMIQIFDGIENNHEMYWGNYCMKKFCEILRECTIKIINFEKKKIMALTNEEYKSYPNERNYHICEGFNLNILLVQKKNREHLEATAIIQVITDVRQIAYVI